MTYDRYHAPTAKPKSGAAPLPVPKPERGGSKKLAILAVLSVIALGGIIYWFMSSPQDRESMRQSMADAINRTTSDTPFAGIGDIFSSQPPPPPPRVTNPPTETGTLSGQSVIGIIGAPFDFGTPQSGTTQPQDSPFNGEPESQASPLNALSGRSAPDSSVVFDQEYIAPAVEDSHVQPRYLSALAQWLADNYKPSSSGGSLNVSVQNLNHECGVKLAGMADGGRAGLLRYAFHPSMIEGLYRLYINRFLADLNEASRQKGLSPQQTRQFHTALAGRAAVIATAVDGVLRIPDLSEKLERINNLAQQAVDMNAQLTTDVFELDELRARKASRQEQNALQMRVDGAAARYRRAMDTHSNAQRALADEIRKLGGHGLDDESLLFVAAWVDRRIAEGGHARAALDTCVTALRDLAHRLTQPSQARNGESSQ